MLCTDNFAQGRHFKKQRSEHLNFSALGVCVFLTHLWTGSSDESPHFTKTSAMADCSTSFALYVI